MPSPLLWKRPTGPDQNTTRSRPTHPSLQSNRVGMERIPMKGGRMCSKLISTASPRCSVGAENGTVHQPSNGSCGGEGEGTNMSERRSRAGRAHGLHGKFLLCVIALAV